MSDRLTMGSVEVTSIEPVKRTIFPFREVTPSLDRSPRRVKFTKALPTAFTQSFVRSLLSG